MNYESAKERAKELQGALDAANDALAKNPGFAESKAQAAAFKNFKTFNAYFVKVFKKQIDAEKAAQLAPIEAAQIGKIRDMD